MELRGLQVEGLDPALAILRRGAGVCRKMYKRTEMAAKLGLDAVDRVYDRTGDLEDLDKEERKVLKEYMKETAKHSGGGKATKNGEHGSKPYDAEPKEKETTGSGQAATGPGSGGGGWGPNQQFNFPFGGGYGGVPYGWQGYRIR